MPTLLYSNIIVAQWNKYFDSTWKHYSIRIKLTNFKLDHFKLSHQHVETKLNLFITFILALTSFCCFCVTSSHLIALSCKRKLGSVINPLADFQLASFPRKMATHSPTTMTASGGVAKDLLRS